MDRFILTFVGQPDSKVEIARENVEEARDAAIQHLGRHLAVHPEFANDGHWQLNVSNESGQELMHVIVAAVVPRASPLHASNLYKIGSEAT
jgi:hypothetical protein